MAVFKLYARVLPAFTGFTMKGSVTANWNDPIDPDPAILLALNATLTITNGLVEIVCESNLFGTDNYDGNVILRAHDLARAVVNSYAFAKGLSLSVFLESVIKPDGIKYNIQEHRPDLEPLVTVLSSGQDGGVDIQSVLPVILTDPTIFVALNDLIGSLTYFQEAPVKCGRAMDAIRHSMAPANDRKHGWRAMRENLNIDQAYLEFITEQSKAPRHGNVKTTTSSEARETIRRSWMVMNRFLEFKKRNSQPLPLSEFLLLED